jgi:hypothetical protein
MSANPTPAMTETKPETHEPKKAAEKKPKTAKAKAAPAAKKRDPRLPGPGAKIHGRCGGKDHEAMVLKDGFEYHGKHFTSISALATKIRGGVSTNGFLFFGLIPNAEKKAAKAHGGCGGITADRPKKKAAKKSKAA